MTTTMITLRASCGAVYCNQSCLFVGVCVCVFVGPLVPARPGDSIIA